jgi:hypothetical protein
MDLQRLTSLTSNQGSLFARQQGLPHSIYLEMSLKKMIVYLMGYF